MQPIFTADWNEQFIGIAFYCGFFSEENTFEITLQIGWLELSIGVRL